MPLLLSKREAAKLLGIGRDTLAEVIQSGHLRITPMGDHEPKIAREECERFAREGVPVTIGRVPPANRRAVDAIRDLRKEFP